MEKRVLKKEEQGRSQVFIGGGGGARWGNINLSIETFLQNREKL